MTTHQNITNKNTEIVKAKDKRYKIDNNEWVLNGMVIQKITYKNLSKYIVYSPSENKHSTHGTLKLAVEWVKGNKNPACEQAGLILKPLPEKES